MLMRIEIITRRNCEYFHRAGGAAAGIQRSPRFQAANPQPTYHSG